MIKTLAHGISRMVATTRIVAGILHPAGTRDARKAETDLHLYLSELHALHTEADEVLRRIQPSSTRPIPMPSVDTVRF